MPGTRQLDLSGLVYARCMLSESGVRATQFEQQEETRLKYSQQELLETSAEGMASDALQGGQPETHSSRSKYASMLLKSYVNRLKCCNRICWR